MRLRKPDAGACRWPTAGLPDVLDGYHGLVEIVFAFGLCVAFYIWQKRSLDRDIKARRAREAAERREAPESAEGEG